MIDVRLEVLGFRHTRRGAILSPNYIRKAILRHENSTNREYDEAV